nr:hypothetical protein [Tanacetum cinerariifolium]
MALSECRTDEGDTNDIPTALREVKEEIRLDSHLDTRGTTHALRKTTLIKAEGHFNGQGRWPAKFAKFILDLLKNAESNAEEKVIKYKFLNPLLGSRCISPRDNYASVKRENRELKLEVTQMRMRLTDLEKDHVLMKQEHVKTHPANKLFKSLTKKLAKLNTLFRIKDVRGAGSRPGSESRFMFQKRRRNSIA